MSDATVDDFEFMQPYAIVEANIRAFLAMPAFRAQKRAHRILDATFNSYLHSETLFPELIIEVRKCARRLARVGASNLAGIAGLIADGDLSQHPEAAKALPFPGRAWGYQPLGLYFSEDRPVAVTPPGAAMNPAIFQEPGGVGWFLPDVAVSERYGRVLVDHQAHSRALREEGKLCLYVFFEGAPTRTLWSQIVPAQGPGLVAGVEAAKAVMRDLDYCELLVPLAPADV